MGIVPKPSEARCNNSQRKAWAILAEDKFSKAKEIVDEKNSMVNNEIGTIVFKRLGIDVLDIEITKAKEVLETLEQRRSKLVGGYGNKQNMGYDTEGEKLKKKMMGNSDLSLRDLFSNKNEILVKIWAAQTIGEGMQLVNEIDKIVSEKYTELDVTHKKMLGVGK